MTVDSGRFTLDTDLLVYSVDSTAGARHDLAVEIVDRATECDCYLTLQALSEFYAAVTRNGIVRPAEAAAQAERLARRIPLHYGICHGRNDRPEQRRGGARLLLGCAPGGDRRRGGVRGHAE